MNSDKKHKTYEQKSCTIFTCYLCLAISVGWNFTSLISTGYSMGKI